MAATRCRSRFHAWALGPDRARVAVDAALARAGDRACMARATRVVVGIACDSSLRADEVECVMQRVCAQMPSDAELAFGSLTDRCLDGGLRVSIGVSGPVRRLHS
jgi:cell division GTPase FtsZ